MKQFRFVKGEYNGIYSSLEMGGEFTMSLNYPIIPKNVFYRICNCDKIFAKFSNEDRKLLTQLVYRYLSIPCYNKISKKSMKIYIKVIWYNIYK